MSDSEPTPLPQTCKAAVLHEQSQELTIESIPTPQPVHGAIVVKVLATPVYGPWKAAIASGFFDWPRPFAPNGLCVGRVAAIGPDTTTLTVGQLVLTDYFLRARDNPDGVQALRGAFTFGNIGARKLGTDVYRHGCWAEYMLVAHENCHMLDEARFTSSPENGGLGFNFSQLTWLGWHAIAYSGLRDIELQAGETIAILPATGVYGGCAVEAASAMGARVIACGRNVKSLQKLSDNIPNVKTVQLTGDPTADSAAITAVHGPIDTFLDLAPPTLPDLNHTAAGFGALKTYGRASIMGGVGKEVPLNYLMCVFKSWTIKGRFMYSEHSVRDMIKLAAAGAIKPSNYEVVAEYKLEEWKEALDKAEEAHGWGKVVTMVFED